MRSRLRSGCSFPSVRSTWRSPVRHSDWTSTSLLAQLVWSLGYKELVYSPERESHRSWSWSRRPPGTWRSEDSCHVRLLTGKLTVLHPWYCFTPLIASGARRKKLAQGSYLVQKDSQYANLTVWPDIKWVILVDAVLTCDYNAINNIEWNVMLKVSQLPFKQLKDCLDLNQY